MPRKACQLHIERQQERGKVGDTSRHEPTPSFVKRIRRIENGDYAEKDEARESGPKDEKQHDADENLDDCGLRSCGVLMFGGHAAQCCLLL
jgi:hypothetical protein